MLKGFHSYKKGYTNLDCNICDERTLNCETDAKCAGPRISITYTEESFQCKLNRRCDNTTTKSTSICANLLA